MEFRNAAGKSQILYIFLFQKCGLFNPFEQFSQLCTGVYRLTALQILHSVIKTGCCLQFGRVAFTVRPKLKGNILLIELFRLILYFKDYKKLSL